MKPRSRLLVLCATALAAVSVPAPATAAPRVLPVYEVSSDQVPARAASRLARELGIDRNLRASDGALRYIDSQRFGDVPMQGEATLLGRAANHTVTISCSPGCAVQPGQTVRLTANTNAAGPVYAWDLDNDGVFDDSTSSFVDRSFDSPGSYPVRVRVTEVNAPGDSVVDDETIVVSQPSLFPADEGGRPTTTQRFDIPAIGRMTVLSGAAARSRALGALRRAGLLPRNRVVITSNTRFGIKDAAGNTLVERPIDTAVSVVQRLRGLRLEGPGAELRIAFDGSGRATQVVHGLPRLRAGPTLPVLPAREADRSARASYAGPCGAGRPRGLRLRRKLIYHAPPATRRRRGRRIMPAYSYSASALVDGRRLPLRGITVPAVSNRLRARISATSTGSTVRARARVRGGRRPYQYAWTSCTTSIDPSQAGRSSIRYQAGRRAAPLTRERLVLTVTDASGFTTQASRRITVAGTSRAPSPARASSLGRVDVGTSWMGPQARPPLRRTGPNAGGFIDGMGRGGVPTQFNWQGEDAFETDFEEPGSDNEFADDVDAVFYTGHASNRDGFQTATRVGDGSVNWSDPLRWGTRDLEWLTVAACGPLGGIQTGDLTRWLPAFDGLHMLMGYANNTPDNDVEGRTFSRALFPDSGGFFGIGARSAYNVRTAWAIAAIEATGPSHVWGSMGVIGPSGESNSEDFFWGQGSTGPDIPRSQVRGYWWWTGTG